MNDDKETWDLICRGDTSLIFQLDSSLGMEIAKKVQPRSIPELSDVIALQRPGPANLLSDYCNIKFGKRQIRKTETELDDILQRTNGQLIYQEQVIEIARQMAKYTLEEADELRKILGKKLREKVEEERKKFIHGWKYEKQTGENLFDQIERFAHYSFNFAHALSYALISYETAFLKAHHPLQFYLANLKLAFYEADSSLEISKIIADAKHHGIKIIPPSIDLHNIDFEKVNEKAIAFGFSSIKGIGEHSYEKIQSFAGKNKQDVLHFCYNLNKRVAESLIKAGVFSSIYSNRIEIFHLYRLCNELTKKEWRTYQGEISFEMVQLPNFPFSNNKRREKIKEIGNQIEKNFIIDIRHPEKTIVLWELNSLGFALTYSINQAYKSYTQEVPSHKLQDLFTEYDGNPVEFFALISELRECLTKKDKLPMSIGQVYDDGYRFAIVCFPDAWKNLQNKLRKGTIALLSGTKRNNSIIINKAKTF